jgi:glucosamine-6-phosphate deaminase
MRVLVYDSPDTAADKVAQTILRALGRKPELVLGFATGSTPVGVYSRLIRAHKEEGVDFSRVHTFNLDEYLDLPENHPQSYRRFMEEHLFSGLNVPRSSIHFPPSQGNDLHRQCQEYENLIRARGGIDIQILGIGSNGHIGFNEPTSSLASRTRVKTLAEKTLKDNSRFYSEGEEQPQLASTMGIGTILEARKIVLQAFGVKKADAVKAAVEGPITSFWPGSALQLHKDTSLYLDPGSASKLTLLSYYRKVESNESALEDRL